MNTLAVVRYGTIAMGNPGIGDLYTQLVHDYTTGVIRRTADEYSRILAVSNKQVSRYFDQLEEWGLIVRAGSNRSRKVLLTTAPNGEFCRAVVDGVYGTEHRIAVERGEIEFDVQPVSGPADPLAAYAAGIIDNVLSNGVYVFKPEPPRDATGRGYVKIAETPDWRHLLYLLTKEECVYTVDNVVTTYSRELVEQMSAKTPLQVQMTLVQEVHGDRVEGSEGRSSEESGFDWRHLLYSLSLQGVSVNNSPNCILFRLVEQMSSIEEIDPFTAYALPMTSGLELPKPTTSKRGRAATRRNYEVPQSSNGFVYWPNEKLKLDPHYERVASVVEFWNDTYETNEYLNWKLYIPVREMLVEQSLTMEQIQQAIAQVQSHPYWANKLTFYRLVTNPHIVRELLAPRRGHDRLARNAPAIPRKDAVAVEF